MINFQDEIAMMKPSLDVDDIESRLAGADLTDMDDLMMMTMVESLKTSNRRRPAETTGLGSLSEEV